MRLMMIPIALAVLGGCATGPDQISRSEADQKTYDKALAGKMAGEADNCLPNYRTRDMTVIDEGTILFHDGRTTWVNHTRGRCSGLGRSGYAMVTKTFGSQLCRGDIASVTDTTSGMMIGSCSMGDFVPYRPAT